MRLIWLVELLPAALEALVEGAWIAVLYVLVEIVWGRHELSLGLVQLTIATFLGFTIGRLLPSPSAPARAAGGGGSAGAGVGSTGRRMPLDARLPGIGEVGLASAVVLLGGLAGWLLSPAVRDSVLVDPAAALSLHPGGWLSGLAVLRGLASARSNDEETAPGGMWLGLGILAVLWLFGRLIGEPDRTLFADQALPDTLVFMVAGLLALGVAGMRAYSRTVDVDWRMNRQWLVLLLGVVGLIALLSIPAVSSVGQPLIELILALLWTAAELVILVVTLRALPRLLANSLPILGIGLGVLYLLRLAGITFQDIARLLGQVQNALRLPVAAEQGPVPQGAVITFGLSLVALVLVVVVALVWLWLRRRPVAPRGELFEERTRVVEPFSLGLRRGSGRRQSLTRAEPTDAVMAYRAALAQLDGNTLLRRSSDESPAEHARRIRGWEPGGRIVAHLAADYQLIRFAGRRVSASENARALRRFRRLRDLIRSEPKTG